MSAAAPPGWEEVFDGGCVRAQVLHAVLEANGLRPLTRQLEAVDLLPSVAFDRCQVYVTGADAARARELLEEVDSA